jgi:hypothetical protein
MQIAIISLNKINHLMSLMVKCGVLFEVRTGLLNTVSFTLVSVSMPDCWLEVSTHPEGPATGQLDQSFP